MFTDYINAYIIRRFMFFSRHTPSMYPISPGAGFRSPYPSTLPISTSSLPTDFYRFSPTGLIQPHPGLSPHTPHLSTHPAIVTAGPKPEMPDLNHRLVNVAIVYFVVIFVVIQGSVLRLIFIIKRNRRKRFPDCQFSEY